MNGFFLLFHYFRCVKIKRDFYKVLIKYLLSTLFYSVLICGAFSDEIFKDLGSFIGSFLKK